MLDDAMARWRTNKQNKSFFRDRKKTQQKERTQNLMKNWVNAPFGLDPSMTMNERAKRENRIRIRTNNSSSYLERVLLECTGEMRNKI